jgi:hypothetical protein
MLEHPRRRVDHRPQVLYDEFGVVGTTFPETIGIFHSKSLKWCRYLHASYAGNLHRRYCVYTRRRCGRNPTMWAVGDV